MRPDRVLVLGGSGFIGRHLAAHLARREIRVTVPSRRRERAKSSLILLPTTDVVEANIHQPEVLARLVHGQDAVVNLVGILHGDFERAHVELPKSLIAACRAAGVKRLVHMSALGAAVDGPSQYQRTKGMGERAVLEAKDLDVTVFRPSVVFGPEDRFLNLFASFARFLPVIAVPCPEARFQPVYVGDVARAIVTALDENATFDKSYDLAGPREYTMKELVELVCTFTGHHRWVMGLPASLSYLQAFTLEHLPGQLLTRDNLRSMQVPNISRAPFPFGITPQPLEAIAPGYLAHADPRDRYPQLRWRARR